MVKIRHATLKDCKKCAELSKIVELKPIIGGYISERYFKLFVDKYKMFFVAEENNKIVGYILGEPMKGNIAHLGLLSVDNKHRGRGIGEKLIEAFRKKSSEHGLSYIWLNAPRSNKKTLEFYRKCGFKEGKEQIAFAELRK